MAYRMIKGFRSKDTEALFVGRHPGATVHSKQWPCASWPN